MKIGNVTLGVGKPRVVGVFKDGASAQSIRQAKKSGADLAEIRLDLFRRYDKPYLLGEIAKFRSFPLIGTIRSKAEGGRWKLPDAARLPLFMDILHHVDAVDIELASDDILAPLMRAASQAGKRIIVSMHDFKKTPSLDRLNDMLSEAKSEGADIVKIATTIHDIQDVRTLAQFTLNQKDKNIVTVGMGEKGAFTRIFFPALGSLWTYASCNATTAPGQMAYAKTLKLLRDFYRK